MNLLIILAIALAASLVIRLTSTLLPAYMRWDEQRWLSLHLHNKTSRVKSPLCNLKSYFKFDYLFFCILACCILIAFCITQDFTQYDSHAFTLSQASILKLLFLYALLTLAIIDLNEKFLPDIINFSLLWLGLFAQMLGYSHLTDLTSGVIGVIFGYLILWIPGQIYFLLRKQQGLGRGDMKLLAAIGAWLGWQPLLPILLLASIILIVIQLPLILLKRSELKQQLPFGPYIISACYLLFFPYISG